MFNLWISNFDVGTALVDARGLILIYYWVKSEKTVLKSAKKAFLQAEYLPSWPELACETYLRFKFMSKSNFYPKELDLGSLWVLRYSVWEFTFLAIFKSSKSQENEKWSLILKHITLDLSWALTFAIVTIFHNNYIPGHNRAKLKMSHFSSFLQHSWFLPF